MTNAITQNAVTIGLVLGLSLATASCDPEPRALADGFEAIAELDIGLNPHQISFSEDGRTALGISEGFFRVSVGLEDPEVLIAELTHAITESQKA